MRNSIAKVLTAFMITTTILGFATIFPIHAVNGATVFVDPKDNTFPPPPMGVGSTFKVNVTVANITGLAGLSFKLRWDPTLLNCTAIQEILFHTVTPEASVTNIWNLGLKFNNTAGTADYSQTWQDLTTAQADGYAPTSIVPANFTEGKLAAAMLTLKILKAPGVGQSLTCALDLSDVKAGDINAGAIAVTVVDGTYTLNYQLPTEKPFFSVEPATYEASSLDELFDISIKVNNLEPGWAAVGFEFKLAYDITMLDIVSVTEGPWLPPFGAAPNQGTLPMSFEGSINATHGFVQFGDVVMPDVNGNWSAPFPSGTGVLAIIHFKAIRQEPFPAVLTSGLDLYDTKVGDFTGKTVEQNPPVDGYYKMRAKVLGRRIDVFTQFGGQGQLVPSDMFWPQQPVCLYANVTYNDWPEQLKDVAFQIVDPHGTTWGVIYARTNESGIAKACFTLPWPVPNPEDYLGVWNITATVDIAGQIVSDLVQFHYDYLVRIWKVTTDKTSYKHNDTITATIEFGSHKQTPKNVTIAVTALDETAVPFYITDVQWEIGGAVFCQYKNSTVQVMLQIPVWARAGEATIMVGFLDNWPFLGGTVVSGYKTDGTYQGFADKTVIIEAA